MEQLSNCPNCNSGQFSVFIKCTDYTVSNEQFTIVSCSSCNFKFTNPRPEPTEIGKYYDSPDYISHSNTTKGIINKIYHFVKGRAIKRKIKLIDGLNTNSKTLLDIGCGSGSFLNYAGRTWNACGVEPDFKTREYCIKHLGLKVFDEDYLTHAESVSVITMWHVLEHVHALNDRIKEIYSVLENDGYAVIAVPNYTSYDSLHYGKYWAAYDVPRHLYHFSPTLIKSLFSEHGFQFVESLPMKMDSFYVSMLSEKYKQSSLPIIRAFFTGLKSNIIAGNDAEKYSSVIYIFQKK